MRATGLRTLNTMVLTVALAVGTVTISRDVQAQTQPADTRRYQIPAGKLADGLKQFGMQSRLQLLAPPELTKGVRGKSVSGTYTAKQALEQLLVGSGLSYEFVNGSTVVIKKALVMAPAVERLPLPSASSEGKTITQPELTTFEIMTVTGTRIRGGSTPSPVITIGAANIREAGFTDLGEVIRSVSQNYAGGQNPGVVSASAGNIANQNITGGSALNLRGLGPDATLTLLNGRRMSYSGFTQLVDISAIPVEAVERIEIVADGASAIYGSDAVAGVGNVILKRDFDGVTVGARYGAATDGGLTTREYNVTAGMTWSNGGLLATYKDASTDPIYSDQRDYTEDLFDPYTIYPGSDLRSGLLSTHQLLGDAVELRLDALRAKREWRQYSAWSTGYYHYMPETTTSLLSPSIEFSLRGDWTLAVAGTWGKDESFYGYTQTTIATGTTSPFNPTCYCNESRTYEVSAEGPLFAVDGDDARLAVGAGYRTNDYMQSNATGTSRYGGDESSRFAYAELNVPLIGSPSSIPGAQRLVLTGAVRGEDYSSFGSVTTPKLGLIYRPGADFTLKASWGKSFKAPTLLQRFQPQSVALYAASTLGGSGYAADATVLYFGGGNSDLDAERARTWSSTLAFHPEALPSLEAELTWFDIDYTDRVVSPIGTTVQALINPIYAPYIIYSPTPEQQAEIIAAADRFTNSSGAAYDPGNVVAIATNRYTNTIGQRVKGVDLTGSYRFDLDDGSLTIRGSASWLDSSQRTLQGQRAFDLAGTLSNPAKVSSRLGAVWSQGGLTASTFANYTSGVTNTVAAKKTASFTTVDATLRYDTGQRGGAWSGLEFALSAQNLFDRAPPLHTPLNTLWVPYDSTNYSAVGRFLSASVSKHW